MIEKIKLPTFTEQLQNLVEPLLTKQIAQTVQTYASLVASINEEYQPMWKDLSERIKEALEKAEENLEKAELLGNSGWTIPMSATPAELSRLTSFIKDPSSADKAFTKFYQEDNAIRLKELKTDLLTSDILGKWKPVLEEAILNLDHGRYRSCIALLLPLIDGVAAIIFSEPNFHKADKRKDFFKKKLHQAEQNGSITEYVWRSFKGFSEVFFKHIKSKNPSVRPSILNRHLILHGRDIPDANLSDCLRLLQALNTIILLYSHSK